MTAFSEEQIFNAARRKSSPAERSLELEQSCGGDEALLRRVEALLRVHDEQHSFLHPASPRSSGWRFPSTAATPW